MSPRKSYDHWWEWLGDYVKEAMKGWGLGTLLILIVAGIVGYLAIKHGGPYIDAGTQKLKAEASAATAVSEAVTKLTKLVEGQSESLERVKLEHAAFAQAFEDAKEMMRDAPKRGEQTNALLREMVEELKSIRKNELTPPVATDGGGSSS